MSSARFEDAQADIRREWEEKQQREVAAQRFEVSYLECKVQHQCHMSLSSEPPSNTKHKELIGRGAIQACDSDGLRRLRKR